MAKQLAAARFYDALVANNVTYFCGVPDSSLSAFGQYLTRHSSDSHDIAVNEGSAIGLAIGYHLATAKVPLVYMQNSGLGNAINPLVSLADPLVMGIPMLLLIGWRGQPGTVDEPQHAKQGLITTKLLDALNIDYTLLSADAINAEQQISEAVIISQEKQCPVALLVQDGIFEKPRQTSIQPVYPLTREQVITLIADTINDEDILVATTGKTGRELFAHRNSRQHPHDQDVLVVGGMGHASVIAYGIAKQRPDRKVFIIDGDGAALMHLGALPFIGTGKLSNLHHIVINNGAHESVGGQPTIAHKIQLPAIARASGYSKSISVSTQAEIMNILSTGMQKAGTTFTEINVSCGSRTDLERPTIHPSISKQSFMNFLNKDAAA